MTRCGIAGCGKHYHVSCLQSGMWPQSRLSDRMFTCPAHTCHTCASDDPSQPHMRCPTRKLLRCIRCPTAYHEGDHCVTAGTVQITTSQIVCAKHYDPGAFARKSSSAVTHINATWCFICSIGGTLICCERCPASFHAECLKIDPPEGVYHCDHCETGRMPLYGEVVWVKLGHYR